MGPPDFFRKPIIEADGWHGPLQHSKWVSLTPIAPGEFWLQFLFFVISCSLPPLPIAFLGL
jgi:hypothetical protein